ncbi:hypothetical protein Tco_0484915 [Tanacetum coccineum]
MAPRGRPTRLNPTTTPPPVTDPTTTTSSPNCPNCRPRSSEGVTAGCSLKMTAKIERYSWDARPYYIKCLVAIEGAKDTSQEAIEKMATKIDWIGGLTLNG